MQVLRVIQDVSADGYLHIAVPPGMGRRCEVIVLPLEERAAAESYERATLQEQSGFVQALLDDTGEDVWNDL